MYSKISYVRQFLFKVEINPQLIAPFASRLFIQISWHFFSMESRLKEIVNYFQKLTNLPKPSRFVRYGIPFFILMIGGSFGLKNFTSLRYEYSKKVVITPEQCKKEGIEMKQPGEVTLESVYEEVKKIDIDNWTNIRGPRPWEEPVQQQQNKS